MRDYFEMAFNRSKMNGLIFASIRVYCYIGSVFIRCHSLCEIDLSYI